MKIHKLIIENIASLRGKHTIDFDQILSESPLFAITGDTGSGKSTILNSISLALYGKHYKKNLVHYDMVTLGERSGYVHLYFSVRGIQYKAVFESTIRKTNGEFLKKPKSTREFYQLNDEKEKMLELTPEDILKLNYEQFCKTIILNQGMFAEFLTSDFRERKEIISKLYSNEYLEQLNPKLREKINFQIKAKDQLLAKLEGLTHNTHEEIDEEKLTNIKLKNQKDEITFKHLSKMHENISESFKLKQQKEQTLNKISQNENTISEVIKDYNQLKSAEKEINNLFESAKSEYDERYPQLLKALELQKKSSEHQGRIKNLKDKNTNQDNELKHEKKALARLEHTKKDIDEKIKMINLHPSIKAEELNKWQGIIGSLSELTIKAQHLSAGAKDLKQTQESLDKERVNIQAELSKSEQALKQYNIELEDYKKTNLEQQIEQTADAQHQLINLEKQLHIWNQDFQKNQQLILKFQNDLAQNKTQLTKLNEIKDSLQKLMDQAQLENAIALCHKESDQLGHCIICGHDYKEDSLKNLAHTDMANTTELLNEKIQEISKLELATNTIQVQLKQLEKNNLQIVEKKKDQIGQFNTLYFKISNQLYKEGAKTNLSLDLKQLKEKLESEKQLKEKVFQLNEQKKHLLQVAKEKQTTLLEMKSKQDKLINEHQAILEDIKLLEKQIPLELEQLKRELKKFQDYQLQSLESEKTKNRIETTLSKIEIIKKQINERSLEIAQLEKELISTKKEINALIGKEINKSDPNTMIEDLKQNLKNLEVKKSKIQEDLKKTSNEKINLQSKIQMLKEQINDQKTLFQSTLLKIKENQLPHPWNEFDLINLTIDSNELIFRTILLKLENNSKATKEAIQFNSALIHRQETLLEQQKSRQNEIDETNQKLKVLNRDLADWEELYQIIGKDEFRNFILSIVEKNLILQTNYELEKICDSRYQIEQVSKSKSMSEFYVIDHFNGSELRKVSTLSGGETFMVSLAMSLALSEMTKGEADIESFFIDEGFGTLDQDSLEDVFNMLNEINNRGKQIGLISHVKQLTNRIPINVNLNKNRLGNSNISLILN